MRLLSLLSAFALTAGALAGNKSQQGFVKHYAGFTGVDLAHSATEDWLSLPARRPLIEGLLQQAMSSINAQRAMCEDAQAPVTLALKDVVSAYHQTGTDAIFITVKCPDTKLNTHFYFNKKSAAKKSGLRAGKDLAAADFMLHHQVPPACHMMDRESEHSEIVKPESSITKHAVEHVQAALDKRVETLCKGKRPAGSLKVDRVLHSNVQVVNGELVKMAVTVEDSLASAKAAGRAHSVHKARVLTEYAMDGEEEKPIVTVGLFTPEHCNMEDTVESKNNCMAEFLCNPEGLVSTVPVAEMDGEESMSATEIADFYAMSNGGRTLEDRMRFLQTPVLIRDAEGKIVQVTDKIDMEKIIQRPVKLGAKARGDDDTDAPDDGGHHDDEFDYDSLPADYDPRLVPEKAKCFPWYNVGNQGGCGSCWAFAGTMVASDRQCLLDGSNVVDGQFYGMSIQQVLSCNKEGRGCDGGDPTMVYETIIKNGITWASDYPYQVGCWKDVDSTTSQDKGSDEDCDSYKNAPRHETPCKCQEDVSEMPKCPSNPPLAKAFGAKRYGRVPVPGYDPAVPVQASRDMVVKMIQRELLLGGPVVGTLFVYEDFRLIFGKRKNLQAVYRHKWGEMVGAHAVVIVGWGVERKEGGKEMPYWLVRNSWGTNWGDGGYFRIKRGSNECGIESEVSFVEMSPRTDAVQPEHSPDAEEHVQLKVALTDKVSSHISSEFVAPAKEGKAPDASSKGLFLHVTFECTTNCGFKSGFVQDVETDKLDMAERKRIDEANRLKPAEERPRERKHPMSAGDHVDGGEFQEGELTNAIALEVVDSGKGDTFEVKFDMTKLPGGPKGQTVVFYLTAYPSHDDIRVRTAKFSLALPDLDDLAVRLPDVIGEKNGFYAECLQQCDDLTCETDAKGHTVKMNLKAFCSCHFDSVVRHFEKTPVQGKNIPDATAIPPLPAMCTGHGGAALVKAVESKNRNLLRFITSHGASLNAAAAETGRTALMAAVELQQSEFVDFLLARGASPNTAGDLVGHMPLHAAIKHEDTEILEALVKAGADVLARDKDNRVALHRLASHRNHKAVQFLLTHVPRELRCKQLAAVDLHRFTPLHLAAQKGDAEMLTLLISSFRDANKCTLATVAEPTEAAEAYLNLRAAMNMTAALLSAGSGMPEAVRVLEEAGADLNLRSMDGSCVLTSAAAVGHANIVEYLVRRGSDALSTKIEDGIEARGSKKATALYLAAMNNHPEVAKVLLKYGANVNNPCVDPAYGQPWTPLMSAVKWEAYETVDVLLADPNIVIDMTVGGDRAFGFTALRIAIIGKSVPMIKKFCKAGVKMNVPGASRPMPLCLATLLRDEKVVEALLEDDCGADQFIECAELATIPPVVASYLKNGPMTKAYLSKMSKADRKTFYGTEYKLLLNFNEPNPANHKFTPVFTPFEGACSNDMSEKTAGDVINVMLDHGADINQRMQGGKSTCFLQALANDRADIARNLVERGAAMIPNGSDMTAVDVANVAAVFKNLEGLQLVLEKLGDDIDKAERFNAKGKNLVHIAAAGGWLHGLAYLLDRNIEDAEKPTKDSVGETPFGLAVCGGKRQTAHLLLTAVKVQNVDAKICKPLVRAAAAGMDEVIVELLKRPQNTVWDSMKSLSAATARQIEETPLFNAIFYDQPTTVASLLTLIDAKADGKEKLAAFAKSNEAEEAFFAAATFETADTLEAVLARKDLGFDVNAYVDWSVHGPQHVWRYNFQNNKEALARTPVSFAAMAGSEATVAALFSHGAADKEKRALAGACAAKKYNVLPLIAAHHKMQLPADVADEAQWQEWCQGPLEEFIKENMMPKDGKKMPKLIDL